MCRACRSPLRVYVRLESSRLRGARASLGQAYNWNMSTVSSTVPGTGDLPADELRRHGHALIEWLAEYLEHPERHSVLSQVKPGEIAASLPASPPEQGESLDAIFADFETTLLPGITHWNHPSFFAYFAISSSIPGILGELIAAGLDTNAMVWKSSPSATELETVTLDWLRQALGLKEQWFGVINDTASISTMLALVAAREVRESRRTRARTRRPRRARSASRVLLGARALVRGQGRDNSRLRPWERRAHPERRRVPHARGPARSGHHRRSGEWYDTNRRRSDGWYHQHCRASTRCPPSPTSASARTSGCTWTARTLARREWSRSCAIISPASTALTRS